jgi:DNA-binding LacI/PurR family transcriptional regulator
VPDDLSVVGFDDLEFARWSGPALTTIRQPLAEMGAAAADLALTLAAADTPPRLRIELATDLVIRASTAPPLPR